MWISKNKFLRLRGALINEELLKREIKVLEKEHEELADERIVLRRENKRLNTDKKILAANNHALKNAYDKSFCKNAAIFKEIDIQALAMRQLRYDNGELSTIISRMFADYTETGFINKDIPADYIEFVGDGCGA